MIDSSGLLVIPVLAYIFSFNDETKAGQTIYIAGDIKGCCHSDKYAYYQCTHFLKHCYDNEFR